MVDTETYGRTLADGRRQQEESKGPCVDTDSRAGFWRATIEGQIDVGRAVYLLAALSAAFPDCDVTCDIRGNKMTVFLNERR